MNVLLVEKNKEQKHNTNEITLRVKKDLTPQAFRINLAGRLIATDFGHAQYILVDCLEYHYATGPLVYDLFGCAVDAYALSQPGRTYIYYKVDQYINTNSTAVIAIISRHFVNALQHSYYNDPTDKEAIFYDRKPGHVMKQRWRADELVSMATSKISAQHHFHFMPDEIYNIVRDRPDIVKIALSLPRDTQAPMMSAVLLWLYSLDPELCNMVVCSGIFKAESFSEFGAIGKSISTLAKSLQNLTRQDLRTIFEIDVLVNRIDGEVDWAQEKRNRTLTNLAAITPDRIYQEAKRLFTHARCIKRRPTSMSWDKFWDSRWQWSAAGSVHSQYPDDIKFVMRERPLRNKFITLCNMPNYGMDHFSERIPEIQGWTSTKYEWGKQRAIYGCDTTSYVLAHFAFYNCEDVLPPEFPVGKHASLSNVASRVAGILSSKLPFCLDFEDFNSQHSTESMQAVIRAYGDTFCDVLTSEQLDALDWTASSVGNMYINDNVGTRSAYKANGTLFSGWRLTTFMNSVLNRIYTAALATDSIRNGASLHNGDDVLIGTTNLHITQKCILNGARLNIRMQPTKCAFGGIAEFLRVDHIRGDYGQYLTRALATLVHSRIESKPSSDARDLVESMEMRLDDASIRGLTPQTVSKLRNTYYTRQAQGCGMDAEDMYVIKTAHRVVGGMSTSPTARVDVLIEHGELYKDDLLIENLPGVNAYAKVVKEAIRLPVSEKKVQERVMRATYEAVSEKNRRVKIRSNGDKWYKMMRSLYKAHKGSIPIPNYGKAALTGFALDVLRMEANDHPLTRFLASSQRPLEALPFVV